MRLNLVTGEWVIYAPSRRKRPQDFHQADKVPETQINCPFCPNNQRDIELSTLELPLKSGPWQTRVVANKYPALLRFHPTQRLAHGTYLVTSGYGKHEVIIESPQHDTTIATLSPEAVTLVVETYHQRYLALMEDPEIMMVIIFRNHGQAAGASLRHPHSQIIATSVVPRNRRWQEYEAQRYFDQWKRCVYCDMLAFELRERQRIILENKSFVAFVPFAAEVPCEIWIIPRRHQADFGNISEVEKLDFATILQQSLAKLYQKLNNPDYNYIISSAVRYRSEDSQVHWYCQIQPRLTTPAGFELGSGMSINPSVPEVDADFLRE